MKNSKKRFDNLTCIYCGKNPATESDHVIALQFFPAEGGYRDNLPKVPACAECNRQKQKVEDPIAVIIQFGAASESSKEVIETRIPRTLKKNQRLAKELKQGLEYQWVQSNSSLISRRLAIKISEQDRYYFYRWFQFITKGLYYHELKRPLLSEHSLDLFYPLKKAQYDVFSSLMLNTPNLNRRSLANGEFKYAFAMNEAQELSMWAFAFQAVEVFAVTAGSSCPRSIKSALGNLAWKEVSPGQGDSSALKRSRIILPPGYGN